MKTKAAVDHIVQWLTDYCDTAGLNGFVIGVSGGVDSAVTSTLCAKTGKTTVVLNLPIHQASDQKTLADRHIDWLLDRFPAVKAHTVDLSPVFDRFQEVLPEEVQDGLVMANTRSRIRMVALYAYAGHRGLLVAGTGNKVEDYGVGFFTKYGDGGVDIAPIADLVKSEVRLLARELGILSEIAEAVPTDGLWADNRSDEKQIGATYDELEWAMAHEASGGVENGLTARRQAVLGIYRRLNRINRHKVEPIPVAVIPDHLRR